MKRHLAVMIFASMLASAAAAESLERHTDVHHHWKRAAKHINYRKAAEANGYKKVSSLVNFPDFFPGLGVIYVVPDTLPAGPFLSFDPVFSLSAGTSEAWAQEPEQKPGRKVEQLGEVNFQVSCNEAAQPAARAYARIAPSVPSRAIVMLPVNTMIGYRRFAQITPQSGPSWRTPKCFWQCDDLIGQPQMADLMKRVPEEELMDFPLNAQAYANADFSEPNSKFVALFSEKFPAFNGERILDLGCGPADITIRLALRYRQARVVGVDGADAMLDIARKAVLRDSSLANRIDLRRWHMGREENPVAFEKFHAVISNSLLHHMRDPLDLWRTIRACAAPNAAVLVMDLIRPHSRFEAENIVKKYAATESDVLKTDFFNSLLAAYRPAEVREQLVSSNLESLRVEVVSDRHLIAFGSIG